MKTFLSFLVVGLLGATAQAAGADGAALFKAKMCGACHAEGKKGGDLKNSTLDKATMVQFLKDTKAMRPKTTKTPVKATDEELSALADYVISLRK